MRVAPGRPHTHPPKLHDLCAREPPEDDAHDDDEEDDHAHHDTAHALARVLLALLGLLQLHNALLHVRVRLLHRVFDLVEHLPLRLDEDRHVDKELVELHDALLQLDNVLVLVLDVREGVLGRLRRALRQELLREDALVPPARENVVNLRLRGVRFDHLELPPHAVPVLALVPRLHLLVLLNLVDKLARQRAVQVLPDPHLRVRLSLVLGGILLALLVHLLEFVLDPLDEGVCAVDQAVKLLLPLIRGG
mmetsp:Transcript_17481/g.43995  ORF Transcript_17481/g.43995 Transcript_17481/m.43995 type:complete len:249 (+) Transcript_17481:150-896(+)